MIKFSPVTTLLAIFLFSAVTNSQESGQDARLNAELTLSETRVTMTEVLDKASLQSGVVLKTDPEQKAWKIREMPVSLDVRKLPTFQFQSAIAKLFDYRWARSGESGKWTYTLWQDQNARDRETFAIESVKRDKAERYKAKWQGIFDQMASLSKMSTDEMAKSDLAFAKAAAKAPFLRSYAAILGRMIAPSINSLASQQPAVLEYSALSPADQMHFQDFAANLSNLTALLSPSSSDAKIPDLSGVDWSKTSLRISGLPFDNEHGELATAGFVGMMQFAGEGVRGLAFPVFDPSSAFGDALAEGAERINSGEDAKTVNKSIQEKISAQLKQLQDKPAVKESKDDKHSERPVDSRLLKEVEIKPMDSTDIVAILKPVIDKTGISIIAEGWKAPKTRFIQSKGTAKTVLDDLCKRFKMSWELDNGVILIRSLEWPNKRAAMVKRIDVEYWTALVQEKGGLDLDDLLEMARTLTQEQIAGLSENESLLTPHIYRFNIPDARKGLQLLAALDKGTLASVRGQGIYVNTLKPDQFAKLSALFESRGISSVESWDSGVLTVDKDNRLILSYTGADGQQHSMQVALTGGPMRRPERSEHGGGEPKSRTDQ